MGVEDYCDIFLFERTGDQTKLSIELFQLLY